MNTLTLMVVTLNEAAHIGKLKAAIDRLERPDGWMPKTVLIDGGSSDGTAEAARSAGFDRVDVLPGASIPLCRNAVVRGADTEWMAFIDGDCELREDWLMQAFPFMQSADPTILGWPVEPPEPGTWVQRAWHLHWTTKIPRMEEEDGRPVIRYEAFRMITTRNMIFNRAAFDALNGFDEELPTGEDTDFVFRAYAGGMRVLAAPALRVVHHGEPATLSAFYRQQKWHANRSAYKKIAARSGGRFGANAPLFTLVFGINLGMACAGILCAVFFGSALFALGVLPWIATVTAPATRTARRARHLEAAPLLSLLYAAYGFARLTDALGLHRLKKSWKT